MDILSSTTSKEIGEAIVKRFQNLSTVDLPKYELDSDIIAEPKMNESGASSEQSPLYDAMLFTPSSKCPKAFVKERVTLSPDDPSWVIRKMNSEYAKTKRDTVEEHSEDEYDSRATTALDTVSFSTDLAPYMASSADTIASTSLSQHDSDETSLSSNSQTGDITVISVTDEEDNYKSTSASMNPQILESILKDSSNALNSTENHGKFGLSRSRSFTLECPSPLLIDALQENRIGLEPNHENSPPETTISGSVPTKPRARMPVSRSLMFSVAEKKETIDLQTLNQNETESTLNDKFMPRFKTHSIFTEDELKMPVLSIKKLCNESGKFFKPVSLHTSHQNSTLSSQFEQSHSLATHFNNISVAPTTQESAYVVKEVGNNEESDAQEELPKSENIDETSAIDSEANIGQFLKQKHESFKQFLDDFSYKELTKTFLVPPKSHQDLDAEEESVDSNSKLEARETRHREEINNIQEEMNKMRKEIKDNSLCFEEIKLLTQKIEAQENLILDLKNQLRAQEKKQIEWMEYIFDIQTVKLERLLQQQMEVFTRQFRKEEEISINNANSDREFDDFEESIQNTSLPRDYNSSDSSTNSVKTVVEADSRNSNEDNLRCVLLRDTKTTPKKIIIHVPARAYDPDMKPKFDKLSALVKGFLTRQLMKTHKVQGIIKTIKDTMSTALQIHAELDVDPPKSRAILSQDVQLSKRLLNQLNGACHEFSNIFFGYSVKEQMSLIAHSRELRLHPRPKPEFRKMAKRHPRTRSLTPQIRSNSPYSKHLRRKTEFSPTVMSSGRMKRTANSASPRLLNRRICRSSAAGNLNIEPRGVSILQSFVTKTSKKDPNIFSYEKRSPSFFN